MSRVWSKTAPATWQHAMQQVLNGLTEVQVYYDDILVTGTSEMYALVQRLGKFV